MQKFAEVHKKTTISYWDKDAVADYGTTTCYTYGQFAKLIAEIHILFDIHSIQKGDKIAILGKNSSHWIATFIASVNYGAIAVPILDEFNKKDVVHILNHSEAKLFFCDNWFSSKVNIDDIPEVSAVYSLQDFTIMKSNCCVAIFESAANYKQTFSIKYPCEFSRENVNYADINPDDIIMINYTSGTTSLTKGVMLKEKNIMGNLEFFNKLLKDKSERTLSILPAAHVYGLMFGVLAYITYGGKVTFLGKIPSPAVLMAACTEVNPNILTLVPLIFEKIYKMKIRPMLEKPIMRILCNIPFIRGKIYRKIGKKLYDQLGGDGLYQVIIGGAAINKDVEKFLKDIKFPFTVGYGMTECAPLISYIDYKDFVPESVGKELGSPYAETRICREQPCDLYGEIQILGSNVMAGYYKDEDSTNSTFTEDGWLKSGDLGYIDSEGNIYIKGRSKTMLLGPSGENIYPEAIESKIMNLPFVSECVVLQNTDHKLIAFVYPDMNMLKDAGVDKDSLNRLMANNRRTVNDELARFENIFRIEIINEPLPKTPKNTVKRYGLEFLLELHEKNKAQYIKKRKNEFKVQAKTKKEDERKTSRDKKRNAKKSSAKAKRKNRKK